MRGRIVAALTGALVLLGLSVPPGANATLSVTWPAVTAFNPDLTPYTFTLDDDGDGTLYAEWRGDRVEVPHSGQVTMTFPTDGDAQVLLLRCGDGGCSQISDSPPLSVRTRLQVPDGYQTPYSSPDVTTRHYLYTNLPGPVGTYVFDFVWEIRATTDTEDPANPVLATGSSRAGALDFRPPPGLVNGKKYYVLAEAVLDSPEFGDLADTFTVPFIYDDSAKATIHASTRLLYPVRDRYLDIATFTVDADPDLTSYRVSVLDRHGTVIDPQVLRRAGEFIWLGMDEDGQLVPDGVYTVRVTGRDRARNRAVDEVTVTVSNKRLQMVTYKKTFSAKQALIDRQVGSCSTLASPSSHGGKGSLGYYSQTKCRDAAKSSVETEFGIHVPKAVAGKYKNLTISFVGGAAKRAKKAYFVMYVYDAKLRRYESRYQHTAAWGTHASSTPYSGERSVVGQAGRKPAVYWWAGLTEGARYDVQSFTVTLQYQALV